MTNKLHDDLRNTFDRIAAAWKTNDGVTMGACFTRDGSLINPFGERADGRDAIAAMYSHYFTGMLRGTSTSIKVTDVRAVGPDHAFVDGDQVIHGPDGAVVLAVHISALVRRDADGWRLVDARPFTVATKP
jgi:uncharacterized protein (TIGR02246 family)